MEHRPERSLAQDVAAGLVSRREVLRRGAALGLTAPAIAALLAACGSSSKSTPTTAAATTTTAASSPTASSGGSASPAATAAATSTAAPTATQAGAATVRGQGGTLNLLWWEAPNILNAHLSTGGGDADAARVVQEPLADFDNDGNLVAILAAEIPSLDNGGVAQDGLSVTWKLKPGVKWSDGQPFTANDVKFTYDYASNAATSAVSYGIYQIIGAVQVIDDTTVKVTFKKPTPGWFNVFVGTYGMILPQHVLANSVGVDAKNAPFNLKPVGTGAFQVDQFEPGDHVNYSPNPNYRDPTKPFFAEVNLKGGGDAESAARAVLQTGEVDYSWNLQVTASVLTSLAKNSTIGRLVIVSFLGPEKILVNMTDPNKEVDGEKSHLGTPHPFQSDLKVRQAYALAIQRDAMATQLYGPGGTVTANILVEPTKFVSPNTTWKYDITAAGALLDDAGWTKGSDGIRAKNGVRMAIVYQTSTNTLRQEEQQVVKQGLSQLGLDVTLKSVDASVFFSSAAGNPDTYTHFDTDIEMYLSTLSSPYPVDFMQSWYGAVSNIAQKANNWSGLNIERWQDAGYDQVYEQALTEIDPTKQPDLFIKMNDLVVNNVVEIPLVSRNRVDGAANSLQNQNPSSWAGALWDVANWTKKKT